MSTTVISSGGSLDLTSPLAATFSPANIISFAGSTGTLSIETGAVELETLSGGVTVHGDGGLTAGFVKGDTVILHDLQADIVDFDGGDTVSGDESTISLLLNNIGGIDTSTSGLEVLTLAPNGSVTDATGIMEGTFFGITAPSWLINDIGSFAKNVELSLFGNVSQTSDLYITLAPDAANTSVAAATITSSGPMNVATVTAPSGVTKTIANGGSLDLTAPLATYSSANFVSFAGSTGTLSIETSAVELETLSGGTTVYGDGGLTKGFVTGDTVILHDLQADFVDFDGGDTVSGDESTISLLLNNIGGIDTATSGLEVLTLAPSGSVTDHTGIMEGTFFGITAPSWLINDLGSFAKNVELSLFGNVSQTSDLYITLAPDAANTAVAAATISSSGPMMVVCYLRGTNILTPTGERRIEDLRAGDLVATHSGGFKPVKWIGEQSFGARFVAKNYDRLPVKIAAGALGNNLPVRDLYVSPGHSVLLDGQLILARDLVNGITITQPERTEDSHYYLLELDTHDCVVAEGAWAESFADGPGLRNQFHNVADYLARFPDYVEPEELSLYAARPQVGPDLEARLAKVLARTGYTPGALHGYVERAAGSTIEGWACDSANHFYPVEVAIYAGEEELGRTLAHQQRDDLQAAGFGAGRCMFSFELPATLSAAARADLRVVCVADGTVLPCASEITAAVAA